MCIRGSQAGAWEGGQDAGKGLFGLGVDEEGDVAGRSLVGIVVFGQRVLRGPVGRQRVDNIFVDYSMPNLSSAAL